TPADRLAAAEARAAELARRNRLARDLHDSIGHSLSAVTLQAGAARRVLDRDVEFARRALTAIEHTAGTAVAELDRVLGMLREDDEPAASARPTLADLGELLEQTRAAGADLRCTTSEHLGELDPAVSEHAYRVVQEGLSNVLRHAGAGPVRLDVTTSGTAAGGDARLHVRMRSP
ncbi:sensor histidine kinase, partial [Streptomyces sparsus]